MRARQATRRAQKRARKLGVEHESYSRTEVIARDDSTCYLCGVFTAEPHLDHVIPLSRGGGDVPWNIRVACADCNFRKNDRLLEECDWIAPDRLERINAEMDALLPR